MVTTKKIKQLLQNLSIPEGTQPYYHTFLAICFASEDPYSYVTRLNSDLYPEVAKCSNSSEQAVLLSIRQAIAHAFQNANKGFLRSLLKTPKNSPIAMCCETVFIIRCCEYLEEHWSSTNIPLVSANFAETFLFFNLCSIIIYTVIFFMY